jgi:hypothetical protein
MIWWLRAAAVKRFDRRARHPELAADQLRLVRDAAPHGLTNHTLNIAGLRGASLPV